MNPETKEKLSRLRGIPALERLHERVQVLSHGDRAIFVFLAFLVGAASLISLYALERTLLVDVPSYGGTLREGVIGSPRFINPLLSISDADRDLVALTYAGLMGLSGEGSLVPVLAERYERSEDGKTYTFVLREDAQFSDGTSVTAEDVVFTVAKAQDPSLKSPRYADWSGVDVTAVDTRTVRFTLAKPYAPFLELTTLGILPFHVWKGIMSEEFPFSTLQTEPIGAGPFIVERVTRSASGLIEGVSLSANPRYVLGRPYLDGIRFTFYPRSEDIANARADGNIESAYDTDGGSVLTAPYARVFGVFFNQSEKAVFAREEVRKALSLSLDRDAIIRMLGGYATAIMGPIPPGGVVKHTLVSHEEDPTAAGAGVLTGAGWSYDATERVWKSPKGTQTLDGITLRTSNVPELKGVASAVKADWEKLGIPVAIELYEPGDLSQNVIRPRKYEALLYGMVIGRDQDLYAFWDSQERNDPGLNIALYANKSVDALLEEARSTSDNKKRVANLEKIQDTIATEYPAAFLYSPSFVYSVPPDLRGVRLPQITVPADRFATAASWYRVMDSVWPFFVPTDS